MHQRRRGTGAVTVALAIPVAALGGLVGFATTQLDRAVVAAHACSTWAVEYRQAREDLTTVDRMWREAAAQGGYRPVERNEFRERVAALEAGRPERCNATGRLTR